MVDVSIIGAGVAGLSTALMLSRAGYTVRVYEKSLLRLSAATRSAGILVTIFPRGLLGYALESRDFYASLDETLLRRVEVLWIARSRKCMEEVLDSHREVGLSSRMLDEPPEGLKITEREHVALVEEYIVDAGRVLPVMLSEADRLGVEIVEEEVAGKPGSYATRSGRLRGSVIVAAGPWTPGLVPGLAGELIVYRCQAASIEGARPPLPIEDDSLDYYIVPVSPLRSNIGDGSNARISDPMDGFIPDPEDTYDVLERYASRNPEAWSSRVVQVWSAPCATTRSGMPLIKVVGHDTIVFAGLDGAGLTLAPGLARLLVDMLEGRETPRLEAPHAVGGPVPEPYNVCP